MAAFDGALARQLDFADFVRNTPMRGQRNRGLRLALPPAAPRGADKYKILEHRRRQAQMKARRLLED